MLFEVERPTEKAVAQSFFKECMFINGLTNFTLQRQIVEISMGFCQKVFISLPPPLKVVEAQP